MLREALLKIHLYVGLAAGAVLAVMGATGGILAFDGYYDRWLHPALWRVVPQARTIGEAALVETVARRFPESQIESIEIGDRDSAQVFSLGDRTVFVDAYSGGILGSRRKSEAGSFVSSVRRIHTRLGAGYTGRLVVDYATILSLVLIPSGLCLWWKKKTWTVTRGRSWRRVTWDLHSTLGIYSMAFLLVLSASGFFLAFDDSLFWVARSTPQPVPRRVSSVLPAGADPKALDIGVGNALATADRVFPNVATSRIRFPNAETAPYVVEKRNSEWIAGSAPSSVIVDRYSGAVLRVDDARRFTRGYRAYRINLALHTGTLIGLPGRVLLAISSLLLPVLAVSGMLIWLRKRPAKQAGPNPAIAKQNEFAGKY